MGAMTSFWSTVLRVGLLAFLLTTLAGRAGLAADNPTPQHEPGSVAEKTATPKEDDRLPIYKEGWQFMVAPYLWIPGAHLDLSHQGKVSGSVVANMPWYEIVPLLFSKVMGGMGRVEIWYGKWGVFSDTTFIYIGESISAGGAKELKLTPKQLPVTIPVKLQLSGDLKLWTRLLWQDVGVRYLIATVPLKADRALPVMSFEALGGLRYTYYNQDTSLSLNTTLTSPVAQGSINRGGNVFSAMQLSILKPFLGMRVGVWFTPKLNLLLRADCGGFGFGQYNSVDSVLEALLGYQVHKDIRIYGGYRGRYFSATGSTKDIAAHGWFHGPMLGAAFSF
jgi:hypothetical protein